MTIPDGTFDGAGALKQIENNQALVVPYAARVRLLADRLGQNFDATVQVFDNLPLAQNGERHRILRAKTAQFLAFRASTLKIGIAESGGAPFQSSQDFRYARYDEGNCRAVR